MKCHPIYPCALAALAFGLPLMAQTTLPGGSITTPIVIQQSFTTGMVGFTTNQTARLNVFNLNAVPSASPAAGATTTTTTTNCTLELQFFDNKGTLVQQTIVSDFAPGASTSYDLPRATVTSETAARVEIRGAVLVNPTLTPASTSTPGYCTVFTTLEIFDATGSTVSSTSDTRATSLPSVVPVVAAVR